MDWNVNQAICHVVESKAVRARAGPGGVDGPSANQGVVRAPLESKNVNHEPETQ